jgi:alanyl-tRNA synthetase
MRHGHKFGVSPTFFNELVPTLVKVMGAAFPELVQAQARVRDVLLKEGEQFERTLETGMTILDAAISKLGGGKTIDGETVFKLYDTYGFPVDLTSDIARERGLSIDSAGYETAMQKQREQSQAASKFGMDMSSGVKLEGRTDFLGYATTTDVGTVVALLKNGETVQSLARGDEGEVVLDRTPFYAESGGQVGDTGTLGNVGARFIVGDTQKRGSVNSHLGKVDQGAISVGDKLAAHVDAARRRAIMANHSATHLLHAALRKVLGTHVQQKGSLVAPDRLRFDFSHVQPITADELRRIERMVNEEIRKNVAAETREMPYDAAVSEGAIALFGEKYEKDVRVLRMGEFSMELCGGTHVSRSGDIGIFKLVSEGGVAAGVRRIEAITAEGALEYVESTDQLVKELAGLVRGTRDDVKTKVADALERIRQLEKENRSLKDKLASGQGTDLSAGARDIAGVKVLAAQVDGADAGALRNAVDQLKDKFKSAVIVLASVDSTNKITLVAGVTADQTAKVKAGELVGSVAGQVGGKGGGRPDFAQAGGNNPAALPAALASVEGFVRAKLGA